MDVSVNGWGVYGGSKVDLMNEAERERAREREGYELHPQFNITNGWDSRGIIVSSVK